MSFYLVYIVCFIEEDEDDDEDEEEEGYWAKVATEII